MSLKHFDIIVIIPLEEELSEFMEFFPSIENLSTATEFRHVVDSGVPGIRMLVAQQEEMGRNCASYTVSNLLEAFDTDLVICIGIAGSLSKDMRLGLPPFNMKETVA